MVKFQAPPEELEAEVNPMAALLRPYKKTEESNPLAALLQQYKKAPKAQKSKSPWGALFSGFTKKDEEDVSQVIHSKDFDMFGALMGHKKPKHKAMNKNALNIVNESLMALITGKKPKKKRQEPNALSRLTLSTQMEELSGGTDQVKKSPNGMPKINYPATLLTGQKAQEHLSKFLSSQDNDMENMDIKDWKQVCSDQKSFGGTR